MRGCLSRYLRLSTSENNSNRRVSTFPVLGTSLDDFSPFKLVDMLLSTVQALALSLIYYITEGIIVDDFASRADVLKPQKRI